MPFLIERQEAIARLADQRSDGCLMCEVAEQAERNSLLLARAELVTVVLSRYPRQWGHTLVIIDRHVTRFADVTDAEWSAANRAALRAARVLEAQLQPSRCYVASLGCERTDLPMSSPHLHVHVIPVQDSTDRPSEIFSWEQGIYDGTPADWRQLHKSLSAPMRTARD